MSPPTPDEKEELIETLLNVLPSITSKGVQLFVVEGDILLTEKELRAKNAKQLRLLLQCHQQPGGADRLFESS